jgi:hypothetical protein
MGNQANGFRKPGRAKRLAAKFLVVAASVAFGLLLCEVALRVMGYTYPVFYEPDAARGYALRPSVEGWYRKENETYVRINSAGLRDREHEKAKPKGTLRIAVVGDSYAEALQVAQEKAFWSIAERRLQECGAFDGRPVEFINFGVSGYGTAQELITLRQKVWDYSPDIVLLAVTTNNDITDNSRALKKTDEIPYFVMRDGQLTLDDSFRSTPAFRLRESILNRTGRWFRDHLRFIQAIHQAHGAIKSAIASRRARNSEPPAQTASRPGTTAATTEGRAVNTAAMQDELGIDNMIYREPDDDVWRDAWTVTEHLITEMRDEVRSKGAKFLVVTLSSGIQVAPNPSVRAEFMQRLGINDLFYPERRIKALGDREGFAVFNLAPALQQYAEQRKVYLHGFGTNIGNGHWNEAGHAVAGEMIAGKLCEGMAN